MSRGGNGDRDLEVAPTETAPASVAVDVNPITISVGKAGKAGDMVAVAALLPRFEQELANVERFLEGY